MPALVAGLAGDPAKPRRWWLWFILLLFVPYIPELIVRLTAAIAAAKGCAPADATPCALGPLDAGILISAALTLAVWRALGFAFGGVLLWLFACLVVMSRMWHGLFLRLSGAFVLTSVSALLPYLAPLMSIDDLRHAGCQPNEGGVGICMLYGTNVGDAPHLAVTAGWLVLIGLPAAGLVFVVYAVTAIVLAIRTRRAAKSS
jgi:hypothetical protein